ncbi:MAG TPA: ABC transporter permease subunit [Clostridiales bacterium]|nr:ABC transporter permease subunit [Clostridiales bacterium]
MKNFMKKILYYKYLYILAIPGLLLVFIFSYLPMGGLIIAFKDYKFLKGIFGSPWVGLENFKFIFTQFPDFYNIVFNTLIISVYKKIFITPFPIILALLINELRNLRYKKLVQTTIYLPHFVSWAIFGTIIIQFLSPEMGLINGVIKSLGFEPIYFLTESRYFRTIVVLSELLKESGWSTIIYLAAISNIDTETYNAAIIDGANRFQRAIYITVPGISDTIVFLFLLSLGQILNVSFDQIYVLLNPLVYDVGDIISTYVYRIGIGGAKFSLATAIGLFQSFVGMTLIITSNQLSKKLFDKSIW